MAQVLQNVLVKNESYRSASQKRSCSHVSKKPNGLRQRILIAGVFVPLGVELIRLIEELLKLFKP